MSLADHADNRRRTTKTTIISPPSQTVFLCDIMQPAAFICVICVICGRIFTQEYSIYIAQTKPQCLPQISLIYADKTQTTKTTITAIISQPSPTCLSLRNNAACCIPLRDLRNLRENIHMRVLNQSANKKPQKSPADLADLRRQTTKQP